MILALSNEVRRIRVHGDYCSPRTNTRRGALTSKESLKRFSSGRRVVQLLETVQLGGIISDVFRHHSMHFDEDAHHLLHHGRRGKGAPTRRLRP